MNRIKKTTDEAQNAFHALSQQLYAQGQPQPEGPGPAASGPSHDRPATMAMWLKVK